MSSARRYMRSRIDRRPQRREERAERLEYWETLSPAEQLKALDIHLGQGCGAKRQRARLAAKIEATNKPAKPPKKGGRTQPRRRATINQETE